MTHSALPQYQLSDILAPHHEELAAVARDSTELTVTVSDIDNMSLMHAHGPHGDKKRLVLSATPLLAGLDEMDPFVRLSAQALEADVVMADAAQFYLQDKAGWHGDTTVSARTDHELISRRGPHTITGEMLRRTEKLLSKNGEALRSYEEIWAVGHSQGGYLVANMVDLIAVPEIGEEFAYVQDEYDEFMDPELGAKISDVVLGEVPAVRQTIKIDGLTKYAAETFIMRSKTQAVEVAEELLGVRALFKTGMRTLPDRAKELNRMMPFIDGYRHNTTRPQLVRIANVLPNVELLSVRGKKSLIHPAQEAHSLRTGHKLGVSPEDFTRFRERFRAYEIAGMGHNATNSQPLFAAILAGKDRGWLPGEDATIV